jgi:hypothetical protein
LGKAFCYYYRAVHEGHVPNPQDLRRYYREQLALAEQAFKKSKAGPAPAPAASGTGADVPPGAEGEK